MYVRLNEYRADQLSDYKEKFCCVHCGHEAIAAAFAYGAGVGLSPYGIDDGGAERRAKRGAANAAARQASFSIRIAPCPKCGKRNMAPIRAAQRTTLLMCLLILGAGVGLVALSGQRWQASLAVGLVLGALPAMLLWKHRAGRIYSKNVRFEG